jgi:hypothetical protein
MGKQAGRDAQFVSIARCIWLADRSFSSSRRRMQQPAVESTSLFTK